MDWWVVFERLQAPVCLLTRGGHFLGHLQRRSNEKVDPAECIQICRSSFTDRPGGPSPIVGRRCAFPNKLRPTLLSQLFRKRTPDAFTAKHPLAMPNYARQLRRIDAISLQPLRKSKEVWVCDGVDVAHDPRSSQHVALDEVEAGAH